MLFDHGLMNCPHCNEALAPDYSAAWCPFCGKNLALEPAPPRPPGKFRRALFFCALLGPALLTLFSAAAMRFTLAHPQNEGISPIVVLVAGPIGGVICGVLLAFQSRNLLARIILSIVWSAIMIIVCVVLGFFGCGIGGYQMRFG